MKILRKMAFGRDIKGFVYFSKEAETSEITADELNEQHERHQIDELKARVGSKLASMFNEGLSRAEAKTFMEAPNNKRANIMGIQAMLKMEGFDPDAIDGFTGENTEKAIQAYMRANNISGEANINNKDFINDLKNATQTIVEEDDDLYDTGKVNYSAQQETINQQVREEKAQQAVAQEAITIENQNLITAFKKDLKQSLRESGVDLTGWGEGNPDVSKTMKTIIDGDWTDTVLAKMTEMTDLTQKQAFLDNIKTQLITSAKANDNRHLLDHFDTKEANLALKDIKSMIDTKDVAYLSNPKLKEIINLKAQIAEINRITPLHLRSTKIEPLDTRIASITTKMNEEIAIAKADAQKKAEKTV